MSMPRQFERIRRVALRQPVRVFGGLLVWRCAPAFASHGRVTRMPGLRGFLAGVNGVVRRAGPLIGAPALMLLAAALLGGCASSPTRALSQHAIAQQCAQGRMSPELAAVPMPQPRPQPPSLYGNRPSYVVNGRTYHVLPSARGYDVRGIASWYGARSQGKPTSSLQPYDLYKYTAASKVLPLPTFVRVTNLDNGKCVIVRVNDRGPFVSGRIIDLSYIAAMRIGLICQGTAPVRVQAIDANDPAQVRALRCGEAAPQPLPSPPTPPVLLSPAPVSAPVFAPPPMMQAESGVDVIYLQVGAFSVRADAERVIQLLRDNRLNDANMVRMTFDGHSLWFVRVGPLDSSAAADALTPQLILLGLPVVRIDRQMPSH